MSVLSPAARHEYYVEIGNGLPPPVAPTDKNRELRITTAIEAFNVLRPGDAYEGLLAVQIVLSGAHAVEAMREAGLYRDDFPKMCRCRAQAAGMMRAGASAKRTLEREQKGRLAAEAMARTASARPAVAAVPPPTVGAAAAPPASAQAGSPLVQAPPAQVVQEAAAAPVVPPAVAQPGPVAPLAAVPLAQAGSAAPLSPAAIEKAETFMADNLEAAVRIRHDRGVTPQAKALFRSVRMPTDPAVIDALVRGTSPLLNLLVDFGGAELDAAD